MSSPQHFLNQFRCTACGKITAGRVPTGGDGTFRYPRRHKGPDGATCPGCYTEAEWVTVAAPPPPASAAHSGLTSLCCGRHPEQRQVGANVKFVCPVCRRGNLAPYRKTLAAAVKAWHEDPEPWDQRKSGCQNARSR